MISVIRIALVAAVVALLVTPYSAFAETESTPSPSASVSVPEDESTKLMIVLDASGSMKELASKGITRESAARKALNTVIDVTPESTELGLRVFGATKSIREKGHCQDSQLVVASGTNNRDKLYDAVKKYKPYGETPIPHALREAAKDLGSEGQRGIVLISDGESTCQPDPCKVAKELIDSGVNLRIDVVGLTVSSKVRKQLQCVAKAGNGSYYDAKNAAQIESSLLKAVKRAARPFSMRGTLITGGSEGHPTKIVEGDWLDVLNPAVGHLYYSFSKKKGTTLRVAAVTQGQTSPSESILVQIFNERDELCSTGLAERQFDTRNVLSAGASTQSIGCDEAGDYVIKVGRSLISQSNAQVGIRVVEEPVVEKMGAAPSVTENSTPRALDVAPVEIDAAESFTNAVSLTEGRWSGALVPSEAPLFAIPLEYGQSAHITVDFPSPRGELKEIIGKVQPIGVATMYDPMQAQIQQSEDMRRSGRIFGESFTVKASTVNREPVSTETLTGGTTELSGNYYLGLSLKSEEFSAEIPYVISVVIEGDEVAGPTYANDQKWSLNDRFGSGGFKDIEYTEPKPEKIDISLPKISLSFIMRIALLVGVVFLGVVVYRGRDKDLPLVQGLIQGVVNMIEKRFGN